MTTSPSSSSGGERRTLREVLGHLPITARLTLVLLAVGLAPLLASQFLTLQQFKASLLANRIQQAEEIGDQTLEDLEALISRQGRDLASLAALPSIRTALGPLPQERLAEARAELEAAGGRRQFSNVTLLNQQGQVLLQTGVASAPIPATIAAEAAAGGGRQAVLLADPQRGRAVLALPLRGPGGEAGLLAADLNSTELEPILESQQLALGRSGRAQLVVLQQQGRDRVMVPLAGAPNGSPSKPLAFEPLNPGFLGRPLLSRPSDAAGNVTDSDGLRRVGAWIPAQRGGIGLLVSMDRREVLAASADLGNKLLALSLITTGLVTGAGLLLGRSLTRPLRELHDAVQGFDAMGEENLRPLAVSGNDEIATLARTFNRMSHRIQDRSATLNRSNNRIQAYIQTVQTALLAIGMRGEITLLNEVGCRLLGFAPARWLGRNWLDDCMVDPEPRRLLREALERAARMEASGQQPRSSMASQADVTDLGEAASLEYHVRSQDGRILLMRWNSSLLRGDNGQVIGLLSSGEDITLHRSQELELIDARRVAEQANAAKSEFLSRMSHELRTPMNAIIGMSYLALRADPEPRLRDYISKINTAGQKLLSIINDILDFSKIEAGKMTLEHTDFMLDTVLADLTSMVAQKIFDKGLELLFLVDEKVPRQLNGDPLRLGQVLLNLLSNACKFTNIGQILLHIRCLERRGERVQLSFEVTDTGIGMEQGQLAKLFQPFEQAELSTTRHFGGTGLGLTICRHLLGLMEGTIEASSSVGGGSSFRATAWFGLGSAPATPVLPEQLNNLRVLLVDDNPIALEVLEAHLAQLPLQLSNCSSGEETLERVQQAAEAGHPFDLVLLDWQLPGIDGLETERQLRQRQGNKAPEVVMVTAFGRDDVRQAADQSGIRGFLTKPVCQSELLDILVGLGEPPALEPAQPAPGNAAEEAAALPLAGLRVLLVEDNTINQQICCELLEAAGVVVTVAEDGAQALQRLESTGESAAEGPLPFDLVLMDLNMPVMDGWEATRRIREDSRWDRLPVLAMTAHALMEERQRCQALGMQDHITKPIEPDSLFQSLARWSGRAGVGGPPSRPALKRPLDPARQGAAAGASPALKATDPNGGEELPGFDLAAGLRRTAGNRRLHRQLLTSLANTQASAAQRVAEALNANNGSEAQRIAHTVKGVAANLGATALAEAAAQLDRALQQGGAWDVPLAHFDRTLEQTVSVIRSRAVTADQPEALPAAAAPAPQPADRAALERLTTLLAEGDGEAIELFRSLEASLQPRLGEEVVRTIGSHLEQFALAAAHQELVAALQQARAGSPDPETNPATEAPSRPESGPAELRP